MCMFNKKGQMVPPLNYKQDELEVFISVQDS